MKRGFDIFGALVFLIVLFPLFVVVALGVKLSSPGPIIYTQRRVGRNGKLFKFVKFRSMRADAEEALNSFLDSDPELKIRWETYQKLDNDPRITSFGSFIRKTSLDELPQFWNVLKGDMSLVGPRPVTQAERVRYGDYWASYCAARPGLTGIWQVSGRSSISYEQRVQMDHRYVTSWSMSLDVIILLKTVRVVLRQEGSM